MSSDIFTYISTGLSAAIFFYHKIQFIYGCSKRRNEINDKKAEQAAALREEEAKKKAAEELEKLKTMLEVIQNQKNEQNPSGLPS